METPKALDPEAAGQAIAVAITISTQVSDKRSIVMQTYLPRDADLKTYHTTLDKLGRAVDRQEAKYNLVGLKVALEHHNKLKKQIEEDYSRVGEKHAAEWQRQGKKGDPKLSPSDASAKSTLEQNLRRYKVEIAKIETDITQCEAEIAKVD